MKYLKYTIISIAFCFQLKAQNTISFVGVDYSLSTVNSSKGLEAKNRNLLKVLLERIQTNGDRVVISFIYENSASVSNQKEFVFKYERPEIKSRRPNTIKAKNREYDEQEKRAKILFIRTVAKYAFSHKPDRPSTHILSMLSLLQNVKNEYGKFNIYLFSDMLEASDRRVLGNTTFDSAEEAKKVGTSDAEKVAQFYGLENDLLHDVQIKVFLPNEDMDNQTVNQFLNHYWLGAFGRFGLLSSHLKFE